MYARKDVAEQAVKPEVGLCCLPCSIERQTASPEALIHRLLFPVFSVFLSRSPLTSPKDFTSIKSRIIQLCLELTSTVQKVSEAHMWFV